MSTPTSTCMSRANVRASFVYLDRRRSKNLQIRDLTQHILMEAGPLDAQPAVPCSGPRLALVLNPAKRFQSYRRIWKHTFS